MKKIIFVVFIAFKALNSEAQITTGAKLYKLQSKTLINILCSIDTTVQIVNGQNVVRYILMHNEYGSAKTPETDEESQQIFLAVSTVDDAPDLSLYATERMYNPKILSFVPKNKNDVSLTYEYGLYEKRKRQTINITPKGCFMSK